MGLRTHSSSPSARKSAQKFLKAARQEARCVFKDEVGTDPTSDDESYEIGDARPGADDIIIKKAEALEVNGDFWMS